jgi:hypothetical protein
MKDKNVLTILLLFVLTITTAVVSNFGSDWNWLAKLIMSLSAIKFILVVFQFMDIKEANSFWKFITVFYV